MKRKQGKNRSGMRRSPPEISLGLDKRNKREIAEFLEKVKQSGKWPHQACTTPFLDSGECYE